mmetsp:Transcript_1662/g.4481  ORF Transcript_1662/g.4481 Transcript_1662/m.4481 type:complete len:419 (+) Transcript_1662:732-1988(+)
MGRPEPHLPAPPAAVQLQMHSCGASAADHLQLNMHPQYESYETSQPAVVCAHEAQPAAASFRQLLPQPPSRQWARPMARPLLHLAPHSNLLECLRQRRALWLAWRRVHGRRGWAVRWVVWALQRAGVQPSDGERVALRRVWVQKCAWQRCRGHRHAQPRAGRHTAQHHALHRVDAVGRRAGHAVARMRHGARPAYAVSVRLARRRDLHHQVEVVDERRICVDVRGVVEPHKRHSHVAAAGRQHVRVRIALSNGHHVDDLQVAALHRMQVALQRQRARQVHAAKAVKAPGRADVNQPATEQRRVARRLRCARRQYRLDEHAGRRVVLIAAAPHARRVVPGAEVLAYLRRSGRNHGRCHACALQPRHAARVAHAPQRAAAVGRQQRRARSHEIRLDATVNDRPVARKLSDVLKRPAWRNR